MISLPADEWAHDGALHEWWYLNSHVTTKDGRSYGIYLFFTDYLIFSLTDKRAKKVIYKEKLVGKSLVATSNGVCMAGSYMRRSSDHELIYDIHYASENLTVDLVLKSEKEPLMVNRSGVIKEGALGNSWYYSLTRLNANGILKIEDSVQAIEGLAWIDRQWGSWEEMGIGSWIWLSLQLSNNCEILLTEIYPPFFRLVSSKVLSIKMNEGQDLFLPDFTVHTVSKWTSPETGQTYGSRWQVESPGTLSLTVDVDFEDQEIHGGLWQGSCAVRGSFRGTVVTGVGYAEQIERTPSKLAGIVSISLAPYHSVMQTILGRSNLGLMDLVEKLQLWRLWSKDNGLAR